MAENNSIKEKDFDKIKDAISAALKENVRQENNPRPTVTLESLGQDADNFKTIIKYFLIGIGFFLVALAGIIIYFDAKIDNRFYHLDAKLEKKIDVLNLRIDKI